MRIAIFASLLGIEATGLSMAVAETASRLVESGQQVTVITTDCGYRGQAVSGFVALPPAVDIRIFPAKGALNRRMYRSEPLIEWVRDHVVDFDVLDIHGVWNYSGMVAARIFRLSQKPYVVTPHGTMTRYDWRKGGIRRRLFFRLGFDTVWNNANAIRFLSTGEQITSYYPALGHSVVIPNGIEVQPPPPPELRAAVREKLGIRPTDRVLLFLGRITHQKGVKEMLTAFTIAATQMSDLRLYIVGPAEGQYGVEVGRAIATSAFRDRITATGAVFGDGKKDYFRAADAFITLSHNEGLSIAHLEALSYGLPMILTRASNLEQLEEYGAGIYTNHDPAQVAGDVLRLMGDTPALVSAGKKARLLADEKFSWNCVVRQMIALYAAIIQDSSVGS